MGLLDKLLGRGTKPAADQKIETPAANVTVPAAAGAGTQPEDETSAHAHGEGEAGS